MTIMICPEKLETKDGLAVTLPAGMAVLVLEPGGAKRIVESLSAIVAGTFALQEKARETVVSASELRKAAAMIAGVAFEIGVNLGIHSDALSAKSYDILFGGSPKADGSGPVN